MKPELESQRGYYPIDGNILARYELHLAGYKGNLKNGSGGGVIAYRIFPDKQVVVYSGLNDAGLSTINGTNRILASLKEEVPYIDLDKFRFFDVLTKRGYDYMFKGEVHITEIVFHEDGSESLIPRIKPSQLPEAFLPVLAILSNP